MPSELESFNAYVNKNADRYIRDLQVLCRQPSVSLQNQGVSEMADLVIRVLKRIGCEVWTFSIENSKPIIVGEIGTGPRCLMIYNHYDVQPAEPLGDWESGPFAAIIRNGAIYARGAADNKGNFAARIAAVEAYQKIFHSLPLRLLFVLDGEEEIGSPYLEAFALKYGDKLKADACLWEAGYKDAEDRHTISLGLKGYCAVELLARGAATEMHSCWGTIVESPAWRLIWALRTLQSEDYRITLDGIWAHVVPPKETEIELLRRISFGEDRIRNHYGIARFIDSLSGIELLKKHFFQPALTICGLHAGYAGPGVKTTLPNVAAAKLEFRLIPDLSPALIHELLRAHLSRRGFEDILVIPRGGMPPAKSGVHEAIVDVAVRAAREVYAHEPVLYPMLPGSGPMYFLCQGLGIPAVSVGVGHAGSHIHAPNENIRIADFIQGIKYIGHILYLFSKC